MTHVGIIGLGEMGGAIAGRLLAVGAELVACDPARPSHLGDAERLRWVGSPRDVAAECDTILVIVADDAQVHDVIEGSAGIVHAAGPQTTVVLHSTVDPRTAQDAARHLAAVGASMIDVGMSRGSGRLVDGSLTLFVGGDAEVIDRVRPILGLYSDNLVHAGPTGTGMALKLCNNLLLHGNRMLLLEAARLARAAGVSTEAMLCGIRSSTGGSWVADHWGRTDEAALTGGLGDTPMVRRTTRELTLASELAERAGLHLPVVTDVVTRLPDILAHGVHGDVNQNPIASNRRAILAFRADPSGDPERLLLTTIGARTGKPRTSPLRYLRDGHRVIVFASNGGARRHPAWYHNLRANPSATIEIGDATVAVTAVELTGDERDEIFARQAQMRPEFAEHQAAASRTIPVIWLKTSDTSPATDDVAASP
ncbi:MAG TPA: nitroreductase/quinone reductase family protein [Pilimelia sp.]|nr:nitroreductase/quinone reductase family protein [Pilimelia sp.]